MEGRLKWKDREFETSLGNIGEPCLKKKTVKYGLQTEMIRV
jgi:hypothetical protein